MASPLPTPAPITAPLALVLELVAWLAVRPRTYDETMEAWRTSCPQMPVWEHATANGLVIVVPGDEESPESTVRLTVQGRATTASNHFGAFAHASMIFQVASSRPTPCPVLGSRIKRFGPLSAW
jgi:hypothetical protein